MVTFQRASKLRAKLRCAVFGPSGSGKTYSCLRIAKGMGGKVALIDTEHGSASKYADRFTFDTMNLANRTIDGYIEAILAARDYDVLIIDSLSHGWQELLEEVDRLAKTKYKGNTWSAWSDGTPKQKKLVEAILSFPGHILATIRSRTEWTTADAGNGKTKPVRVGLTPEQGKGIEYEFDLLLELATSHTAEVLKDRTGKFQDVTIDKPGEDFGKALADWLMDGAEPEKLPVPAAAVETPVDDFSDAFAGADLTALNEIITKVPVPQETVNAWLTYFNVAALTDLTQDQVNAIVAQAKIKYAEILKGA